jgi:hypothetical protein
MKNYRYSVEFTYNNGKEEIALRDLNKQFFNLDKPDKGLFPSIPKKVNSVVENPNGENFIPSETANVLANSVEAKLTMQEIGILLTDVLKADAKKYLYKYYTESRRSDGIEFAKQGEFTIPIVDRQKRENCYSENRKIYVRVYDNFYPTYTESGNLKKDALNTLNRHLILEQSIDMRYYPPLDMSHPYLPNFDHVWRGRGKNNVFFKLKTLLNKQKFTLADNYQYQASGNLI